MTDFHELPTATLENEHIRLDYLTVAGPRIVGLSYRGSANLLADVFDAATETPLGTYSILGGHRLWIAPESLLTTYASDKTGLSVRQIPQGVELTGASESSSGAP